MTMDEVRQMALDFARLPELLQGEKVTSITHKCCQQPLDAIALLGCGVLHDKRPNARICRLRPGMGSYHRHDVVSAFAAAAGMVGDLSSSTPADVILFPHA